MSAWQAKIYKEFFLPVIQVVSMANDDVLPTQVLEDLKYEVEALKKKIAAPDPKTQELLLEMESLKDSLHELITIFQKALEETKEEDLGKLIKTVNEKLEAVVNQNETIARGMIAISDKLDDWMKKQNVPMPAMPTVMRPIAPVQHALGMPQSQGRSAPRPLESMAMPGMSVEEDIPPPPGSKKRSLGLF